MAQMREEKRERATIRGRIYRALYESRDFCSKQTLAARCEISMPTLYQHLRGLFAAGLVRYTGEGEFTGGRRAQGLEIVPEARVALGVSISEHSLRIVAADLRLRELAYRSVPYDMVANLPTGGAELARIIEEFIEEFSIDRGRILGVGVTIPGLLTADRKRVFFAPTLGLRNVSLNELTQAFPYRVRVENDGSASGLAEGYARGANGNLAYLSLEEGVGGAVLMAGEPYAGDNIRSGEFGHICVEPGGLPCSCGRNGCLEAYCSSRRIEDTFGVSLEEFFEGVAAHDPAYESLLYDMLRHLALAVNNIHMTLDCDVVLGGFLSEYLQPYLPVLRRYVQSFDAFSEKSDYVQLSRLRRHITPLGAALYFIHDFIATI